MRLVFNPYSNGSTALGRLKAELKEREVEVLEIKRVNSVYRFNEERDIVINWGVPVNNIPGSINYNVRNCTNKLKTLSILEPINPLQFTDSKSYAIRNYLPSVIFCRTELYGCAGEGIVTATTPEEVVNAKLYTKCIPKIEGFKQREYRVYIHHGGIFDILEKRELRNPEEEGITFNPLIRSDASGWVYCRTEVNPHDRVKELAHKAFELLEMDIVGLDIMDNGRESYVLEANSAPDIDGITLKRYCNFLQSFIHYHHH
jgi:hypothetical protein